MLEKLFQHIERGWDVQFVDDMQCSGRHEGIIMITAFIRDFIRHIQEDKHVHWLRNAWYGFCPDIDKWSICTTLVYLRICKHQLQRICIVHPKIWIEPSIFIHQVTGNATSFIYSYVSIFQGWGLTDKTQPEGIPPPKKPKNKMKSNDPQTYGNGKV